MLAVAVGLLAPAPIFSQSGATGGRASARAYGVNLTFAVYQYDDMRSPAIEEVTRLSGTFSSAEDEIAHIKDRHKLEGVEIRHVREVGLRGSEGFLDAVLLGPQYMDFRVTPQEVARGYMKLDMRVRYGNEPVLDVKGVEFDNFETVLLRGGKGMFGVKYFIGAGGRQESAAIERTLLISVTAEIVPETGLRNRPQQLSQAVDEYGSPIKLNEGDRFTPPVALERVVPKFDTGRGVNGSVLLGGTVTPDGRIINVRVVRSLDPVIDERAVEAFRQYKFSPALLNGQPVHATYREALTFARPGPTPRELQEEIEKQRQKEKEKEKSRKP